MAAARQRPIMPVGLLAGRDAPPAAGARRYSTGARFHGSLPPPWEKAHVQAAQPCRNRPCPRLAAPTRRPSRGPIRRPAAGPAGRTSAARSSTSRIASRWDPNRLDCFVRGTANILYHAWWDGQAWAGLGGSGRRHAGGAELRELGLPTASTASPATPMPAWATGWWDGTQWAGWEGLGGSLLDAPSCVSWGPNRIDCFARGTDAAMWHRWWDGAQWAGWESLGGIIFEQPSCTAWGPNRIDCFARGGGGAMYHRWWDGAQWGWLGKPRRHHPGAAGCVSSAAANRLDCFARGADGAMWHRWWDGAAWGGWERLGRAYLRDPEVHRLGTQPARLLRPWRRRRPVPSLVGTAVEWRWLRESHGGMLLEPAGLRRPGLRPAGLPRPRHRAGRLPPPLARLSPGQGRDRGSRALPGAAPPLNRCRMSRDTSPSRDFGTAGIQPAA